MPWRHRRQRLDGAVDGRSAGGHGRSGGGGAGAGPEVMVRSEFADLVKWVGAVETDERGEAVIELEMPDNLTTWKVKTWAVGHGTRVGEGEAEIITSKDLIVRLQAPRFFIESDEVTLSAVVHNYHEEAKEVAVSLELDGGTLRGVRQHRQDGRDPVRRREARRLDGRRQAGGRGHDPDEGHRQGRLPTRWR